MAITVGPRSIINSNLVLHLDASDPINYLLDEVQYLVIAGGGGGGSADQNTSGNAAGGGAGGFRTGMSTVIPGTAITVTIGNGGNGGAVLTSNAGTNGQNSIFGAITSIGGGGGASCEQPAQGSGGSGGGASACGNVIGATGTSGQGYSGGNSNSAAGGSYGGGGGGGADGPGGSGSSSKQGDGGPGKLSTISGISIYYAGGGGAGGTNENPVGGSGGQGGGGNGGWRVGQGYRPAGTPGTPNTGSGGGGGGTTDSASHGGGAGGSGVVIIRYPGPQKATGGNTITQVNGYTIHTFTTSGTFTPLNAPSNNGTVYGLQDLSNNSNLVAIQSNGPTYSTLGQSSIAFDGVNDGLNLGMDSSINLLTGDFAIYSWFYRENTGNDYGNLIGNYYTNSAPTTNDWQFMISRSTTPVSFVTYRVGTGTIFGGPIYSGYGLNTWINVVLTRVGSTLTLYSNGVSVATETNTSQFGNGSTSNMYIGVDGNGSSEPFGGKVANMLIYKNRGLTSAEVQQNFNALRGRFGI